MKLSKAIQSVYEAVLTLVQSTVLRDQQIFYARYYGTNRSGIILIKNLLDPRRWLTKLRYGQVLKQIPVVPRARNYRPLVSMESLPKYASLSDAFDALTVLRRDGVVIIPAWNPDLAAEIAERYKVKHGNFTSSSGYVQQQINPYYDRDIFKLCTDERLLSLLGEYYRAQPYVRPMPSFSIAYPSYQLDYTGRFFEKNSHLILNRKFNIDWHYDTPNQLTAHFLLTHASTRGTHMLVAKGSHRLHHTYLNGERDYHYSEEFVRKHFELIECVGPLGSLIVFDSNAIHRMEPRKDGFRAHFHINYTPGNDLRFVHLERGALPNVSLPRTVDPSLTDMTGLSEIQRLSTSHILSSS
jgi:hypothetical protein